MTWAGDKRSCRRVCLLVSCWSVCYVALAYVTVLEKQFAVNKLSTRGVGNYKLIQFAFEVDLSLNFIAITLF